METQKKLKTITKTKEQQEKDEVLFQEWQTRYLNDRNNKTAYDKVWLYINDACKVSALKLLKGKGVKLADEKLNDRIMDATIDVMKHYNKPNFSIDKRSSFVYWKVYQAIFGAKAIKEDQEESLDAIEGTDDYNNENNVWIK